MHGPLSLIQKRKLSHQQAIYATPNAAFRSGLEEKVAEQIKQAGSTVYFETFPLPYTIPQSSHKYTCDFVLPNGIMVETKGMFSTEDRKKMKLVKAQHPLLDIRMIFSNARARIAKKSPTTYAKWAETNGFKWAHKDIPKEWIDEPSGTSLAALKAAGLLPASFSN